MKLQGQKAYGSSWVIGDEIWELKFCRNIQDNLLGASDPSSKTISIKQKLSKEEILATFIHEVIHCFETEYGFDLDHSIVYKLEEAITDMILENLLGIARIFKE